MQQIPAFIRIGGLTLAALFGGLGTATAQGALRAVALAVAALAVVGFMLEVVVELIGHQSDSRPRRYKAARNYLKMNRVRLSERAASLYPRDLRVANLPVLAGPGWLPRGPIPLDTVLLCPAPPAPLIQARDGAFLHLTSRTRAWWPESPDGEAVSTYAEAIAGLDAPITFEDRMSYRLVGVDAHREQYTLWFELCCYFDYLNTCEPLAYELADQLCRRRRLIGEGQRGLRSLGYRRSLVDPFDLTNRCVIPGINTLSIRVDSGQPTFFMHKRNPKGVAISAESFHVIPAGEFQPASYMGVERDLRLWHNIMRESNEELLLAEDEFGTDPMYDLMAPYALMNRALRDRHVTAHFLGVVLDALTLKAEVLTACVYAADAFDALFGDIPSANREGEILRGTGRGIPFDYEHVMNFLDHPSRLSPRAGTLPAGAACLSLAWQWRDEILQSIR